MNDQQPQNSYSPQSPGQNAGFNGPGLNGNQGGGPHMPVPRSGGPNALSLLRIILHRWLTVILFAIFGGIAAVFYIQNAIPVYNAVAELEMSVRRPKVINNDVIYEDPSAARDTDVIFNTRFSKFRSPAMETLVAREYIKRYPDELVTSRGMPISRHMLAIQVRAVNWYKDPSANIVTVSYEASDPDFAAKLVNVISHCAGLLMAHENQAQSDEAVKWLVDQAHEQSAVVESVENDLAALREELQLDSIQQQANALGNALISVSEEREQQVSVLESRKTVYDFVVALRESDQSLEMLPPGLPKERELQQLIREWRGAHDDLLLAADRYTEIHPEYRAAAELEERASMRLNQFVDLSAKAVENEISLLEKQIDQIDARIEGMKEEIIQLEQSLAKGMRQVQELERKRDIASDSYQGVLRRIEEARLSADENMAFTKVIRNAGVPKSPISPNRPQSVAMGVVFGAMMGSVLVLIIAFWTDKIDSVSDLKEMGLHILATIPSQKKVDARAQLATIALRDKFNPVVEAFSEINAVISSNRFSDRTGILLMCSVDPGSGKTISACNLAICSANNGTKTLLIDCDLRRPQVANIFNIDEDHESLIEWLLADRVEGYEKLVHKGDVENLDIISSRPNGNITPAELLGRNSLSGLLEWARTHYDRVIIDSPPLGPVGDAQMLSNLSDAVILVVRMGHGRRRSLRYAVSRFNDMHVVQLGCIANDVNHSLAGMFGGGQGYGYGYGNYKHYG